MHELLQAFGLTWGLWGGILFQKDKQESSGSLEALSDAIPQPMPFPPTAVRSGSPKLDPSEVYLKSKTMYEDKREYINPAGNTQVWQNLFFGMHVVKALWLYILSLVTVYGYKHLKVHNSHKLENCRAH